MEKTVIKCWLDNRAEQGKLAEKKIFFFSKKKTFAFILSKEYTFNALCIRLFLTKKDVCFSTPHRQDFVLRNAERRTLSWLRG
jgi:hypothetical protein